MYKITPSFCKNARDQDVRFSKKKRLYFGFRTTIYSHWMSFNDFISRVCTLKRLRIIASIVLLISSHIWNLRQRWIKSNWRWIQTYTVSGTKTERNIGTTMPFCNFIRKKAIWIKFFRFRPHIWILVYKYNRNNQIRPDREDIRIWKRETSGLG